MLTTILLITSIAQIVQGIYRNEIDGHCIGIYDCEPGHEILSCNQTNTKDVCSPCKKGLVQPEFISSIDSNTNCFKPISECNALDITHRREPTNSFCKSLHGCICNTNKCFYGDPCLCAKKINGCPPDTHLNETGDCVPCEKGTWKNSTGCGPCRHFEKLIDTTLQSGRLFELKKENMVTISVGTSKTDTIFSVQEEGKETENERVYHIVVICLGVLVVILFILLVILIYTRRKTLTFSNRRAAEGTENNNPRQDEENKPLNNVTRHEDHESDNV